MLCFIAGALMAQNSVSNIRVQQHDELLYVTYDLSTQANVEAFVSFDNGSTYRGPLQYVTGAIGKEIAPEKDKIFVWNIVKEAGYVDNQNTVIKIVTAAENPAVIAQVTQPVSVIQQPETTVPETPHTRYKRNMFGIDFGSGGWEAQNIQLGLRYTHNFNPYFGWDVFKIGWTRVDELDIFENHLQLLTGLRVTSPTFGGKKKMMDVYAAARVGIGYGDWGKDYEGGDYEYENSSPFCYELEAGIHLLPWFFVGAYFNSFSFNQEIYGNRYVYYEQSNISLFGFRAGFDLGARRDWYKRK